MLTQSGFTKVVVELKGDSKAFIKDWVSGANVENFIVSAVIKGMKP